MAAVELTGVISNGDELSSIWTAQLGGDIVAVKCFRLDALKKQNLMERVLRERRILESVSAVPHAFMTNFRSAVLVQDSAYLCMDFVGAGDLFSLLQKHSAFAPGHVRTLAAEVFLGLEHLHSFDVIHRDLKPENMLVGLDGHLKLADFGSSTQMFGRVGARPPPRCERTLIGTPDYMAPETIFAEPSCEDVDVWSSSVLCVELLCGETPFTSGDVNVLLHNIVHAPIVLPEHEHIGPEEAAFLMAMLVREPDQRLGSRAHGGVGAVFEHPWFDGYTKEYFLTKRAPVPWVPLPVGMGIDNVPPAVPAELLAMAEGHAQGAPPPLPAAGTWEAELAVVGFEAAWLAPEPVAPEPVEPVRAEALLAPEEDVPSSAILEPQSVASSAAAKQAALWEESPTSVLEPAEHAGPSERPAFGFGSRADLQGDAPSPSGFARKRPASAVLPMRPC